MTNIKLKIGLFLIIVIFSIPGVATAGFHIGPMRAVEERAEKLDEKVNEHWLKQWELNCDGSGNHTADKECAMEKAGVTSRVIEYWNENPSQAPADFTIVPPGGVLEARFTLVYEPLGEEKGIDYGKLAWADVDRDGLLDLAVVGRDADGEARLIVFENLGDENFQIAAEPMGAGLGLRSASLAWGDFDNSGRLDLVVMGYDSSGEDGSPRLIVFRNNGNFSFEQVVQPLGDGLGLERGKIITTDFDNNGKTDIVATGHDGSNPRFVILENNTGVSDDIPVFNANNLVDASGDSIGLSNFSAVAAGDYNQDGWPDLAALGQDNSSNYRILIMNNMGPDTPVYNDTGFIDLADTLGLEGLAQGDLEWADITGDGSIELMIGGLDNGGMARLYLIGYDADLQQFIDRSAMISSQLGLRYASVSAGDYNNDGRIDLLLSGRDNDGNNKLVTFENTGSELKRTSEPFGLEEGVWRGDAAWADFAATNRLGLAALGFDGEKQRLAIFANSTDVGDNSRPSRPNIIGVNVYGDSVVLKWEAPDDWETESKSLSYLIRVGSGPGDGDIVNSGSADSHRYYHQLLGRVHPGKNEAVLYNLDSGSYYWAVRAVDGGYQMSRWSEEDSFDF